MGGKLSNDLKQKKNDIEIDPISLIHEHLRKQTYKVTGHFLKRIKERSIVLRHVLYVLAHGYHEKEKDGFDVKFQQWKYSIRGKTPDGVELRIVVAFPQDMAIITAIVITRRKS